MPPASLNVNPSGRRIFWIGDYQRICCFRFASRLAPSVSGNACRVRLHRREDGPHHKTSAVESSHRSEPPDYRIGQPVGSDGHRQMGYNAIVENAHRGLLFQHNLTTKLEIGKRERLHPRRESRRQD